MPIAVNDLLDKVRNADASRLTQGQLDRYWNDGVVHPLTALDPGHALSLVPRFDDVSRRMANWTTSKQLLKSYLVVPWVCDVVRHPAILDAVECVLGPNIMVWGATFFAKPPNQNLHVGWHQDLLYWGLHPADGVLTVWLALSDANEVNGAMQVVKGSHRSGMRRHGTSGDGNNMLLSDQNVELSDEEQENTVIVELLPGQFSMHHSMALHGSGVNRSNGVRVGISINFIATSCVQHKNSGRDCAMLVRGVDEYGHFEHNLRPQEEFATQSLEQYKRSIAMPSGLGTSEDVIDKIVNFNNIS